MSKNYTKLAWNFVKSIIVLLIVLLSDRQMSAQSLACNGGVNVSMDVNCEAIINASHVLKGQSSINPLDYQVIIMNRDGSVPSEILRDSSGIFVKGNQGHRIKFVQEGFYKVTIKRLSDGVPCWGDILIEDKLPPFTKSCPCPENATLIGEKCVFSCASVYKVLNNKDITGAAGINPVFMDNCGNNAYVEFYDDLVRDTACGSWTITRHWRTLVPDGLGRFDYRNLNCIQKFYFEPSGISAIHPPKKIVEVPCGTNTDPESLRKYFSDTLNFTNPNLDSAIAYSYPYLTDTISGVGVFIQQIGKGLQPGTNDDLCKVTATYSDSPHMPICEPYSYKVVRSWHVIDWCTNTALPPIHQAIKVVDSTGPEMIILDTIPAASTDPWFCNADIIVPAPDSIWDNCAPMNVLTWKAFVLVNGNKITAQASNGYKLSGLAPGTYEVFYMASDPCMNSTMRKSILKISDEIKPVALTKYEIVVTFTTANNECTAKVFAHNIDANSFDACDGTMLIKQIRRKGTNDPFGDFVKFSQADITSVNAAGVPFGIVLVELKVTDKSGNFNLGWTRVRVEDKNMDVRTTCGDTLIRLDCRNVSIDSARVLYRPSAFVNGCKEHPLTVKDSILSGGLKSTCNTGSIRVGYYIDGSSKPFCIKTFEVGDVGNFQINWPPQEIEVGCDDTEFGDPTFQNVGCRDIAVTESLQDFTLSSNNAYCKKIVRTIVVIDWCTFEPNQGDSTGYYEFKQTIKVKDRNAPVVSCIDLTIDANNDCTVTGYVLTASATDEGACGNDLTWDAAIDSDDNGTYDLILTVSGTDGSVSATSTEPLKAGTHKVRWRATDACKNIGEKICTITVVDNTPPSPQCITAVSTAVMNTDGTVAIWANDFKLNKTEDDCGGEVRYSFSGDSPDLKSMTFTCQDIADGISQVFTLQVYVWDESDNRDFCTVKLRVDDNFDFCTNVNISSALIAGSLKTPNGEMIESAMVKVDRADNTPINAMETALDGKYAFGNAEKANDYVLKAEKSDDPLNGVSTLDIVLMQRHILDIKPLDDAYKIIAADINGDRKISALDLVTLKRVLLGVEDEFPHGKSWIFINSDQEFENELYPWPLSEKRTIVHLDHSMDQQDFIAVKIGDVNGNAIANSGLAKPRSNNRVVALVTDQQVKSGELIRFTMNMSELRSVYGGQLSLELKGGIWQSVESDQMTLSPSDYFINDHRLTLSWSNLNSIENLNLTFSFVADRNSSLQELITLRDKFSSEVYTGDKLKISTIELSFNREIAAGELEVYQNKPNPFTDGTAIAFNIDKQDRVELTIFDLTGKIVHHEAREFRAGYNEFMLSKDQLNALGVLYYQVNYQNSLVTKKMIHLDR